MAFQAGLEKLPRKQQVRILYSLGVRVVEIAANVGYSRQWVYKLLDRMGLMMKRCECEDQTACDDYHEKISRPGYANITCLYWRKDYLDDNGTGDICTCPPPEKMKEG